MSCACRLCHHTVPDDDIAIPFPNRGACICLTCFDAQTESRRIVSRRLQHEIATEEDTLRGAKLPPDPRLVRLEEGLP